MEEILERIASELKRIADAMEAKERRHSEDIRQKRANAGRAGAAAVQRSATGTFVARKTGKPPAKTVKLPVTKPPSNGNRLIAVYCESFKARYGTNPIIDGKAAGLASTILRTVPLERAQELVQAYLQMEDRWFMTKCHDLGTFVQNTSKIAVALANGTQDPHERAYWNKVFKHNMGDINNDAKPLQTPNRTAAADVGRKALSGGTDGALLGSVPGMLGERVCVGGEQSDRNGAQRADARRAVEGGGNSPSAAELLADCGLRRLLEHDGRDGEEY